MTTRIEFLRAGIAGAVALLFGTGARRTKYTTQQSYDGAPNVLLILADDQPPNTVRAMGDFASRFDRNWTGTGYSDVPVCGPARVGLFTGKYPHNHGATLNGVSWQVYRDGNYAAHDLLSRMRMAGYDVGYFGKLINGYGTPDDPEWEHPATQDEPHRWCTLASGQQKPYRVNSDGVLRDGLTANQTKFFGRQAQDWMLARATDAKPWFCYFALADPHAPHEPTVAYEHTHDSERLVSPGTKEADLSDKSGWTLGQGVAPPTPGRTTGRARWRSSRGCASGALRSSTRRRRPASWTTPW
jgi:arylsulfatase A-like enzyme